MGKRIKEFFNNGLCKGDKGVWMIYFFLCMTSLVEVYSASSTLTFKTGHHWEPLFNQFIFLLIGFVFILLVHRIPCKYFRIGIIFNFIVLPLLIYTSLFSGSINGASRWISIGPISFQPSELGKGTLVLSIAVILSMTQMEVEVKGKKMIKAMKAFFPWSKKKIREEDKNKRQRGGTRVNYRNMIGRADTFYFISFLTLIYCGLILTENFSTAAILFFTVLLMMYVGNVPRDLMAKGLGVVIAGGLLAFTILWVTPREYLPGRASTWKSRIEKKFKKNTDKDVATEDGTKAASDSKTNGNTFVITDDNRQETTSYIAIANSNMIGRGVGNSEERDFLAHAESDFIYSIIIEETGLIGGIIIIMLYIALLIRVSRIAQKCDRFFPAFLVVGLGILMVLQALINMSVAVGVIPVTGQPLPLISRGGTSIIITSIYIGVILSVSRYAEKVSETKELPAEAVSPNETDEYYSNEGME